MQLNGSQIFVEVLCEQGVDTIFGYPGGAVLNLYDELYKNAHRITHVLTAHEQGASHAADGYARATGRTGVVLATSGPGATNLVTGIATAYMDSVPMVAFTGNVATPGIGKDCFQEAYIEGITMPITKHNFTVRRVEDLADTMRAAFRIAQSGRKGPVLVDIPKDVTAAVCEFENKQPEPLDIAGDGVVFVRVGHADHVVRDALHFLLRRRGGADDHAAVDLHRIAGDDLAAEPFGKLDAEPCLAAARGTDDAYEFHSLPPALTRA